MLHKSFQSFFNLVLPHRCLVSGEVIHDASGLSPKSWSELTFIANKKGSDCKVCGVPFSITETDSTQGTTCLLCLECPPKFKKAVSVLVYNDASRPIVLGFKHGDKTYMSHTFGQWMARTGAGILGKSDVIVPVPLHWRRLMKRRYNQSALLADAISKHIDKPVSKLALTRTRATEVQGHLSAKQRKTNVRSAFQINPARHSEIKNKTVCLIDDVLTSGATTNECANVLLKAGAKDVYVLCLARVADV